MATIGLHAVRLRNAIFGAGGVQPRVNWCASAPAEMVGWRIRHASARMLAPDRLGEHVHRTWRLRACSNGERVLLAHKDFVCHVSAGGAKGRCIPEDVRRHAVSIWAWPIFRLSIAEEEALCLPNAPDWRVRLSPVWLLAPNTRRLRVVRRTGTECPVLDGQRVLLAHVDLVCNIAGCSPKSIAWGAASDIEALRRRAR